MNKTHFELDGNLGIFTFNNPPLNFVSLEVMDEVAAFIESIDQYDMRALILKAEGDIFSGGADVEGMFKGRSSADALELLESFNGAIHRFEQLPIPKLAVVQGLCLGGGFELVLTCDMIWAAESANFAAVETLVGTIPLGGGIQRLVQRVGAGRAAEIILSAGFYSSETLEKWQVVNRVLPDDNLQEKALKFGKKLSQGPTLAYGAVTTLIRETVNNGVLAADNILPKIAAPLFESEDMKNGIQSLLEDGPGKAVFDGK